ncbi:ABC transporter A family member 2 [Verticillium dahliae VDG2]|nr:ABC transporter A family member 2 [Verticillium dahliae VDG2]
MQDELASLDGVLRSLFEAVVEEATFFMPLTLPLRQCSQVCDEFKALVDKCTANSNGARPSIRDWVRLRYMDNDIRGFTEMLAGYKSTISITLADATLRSSKITRTALNEYKAMCSAHRPKCLRCQRLSKDCIYDTDLAETPRQSLRRKYGELELRNAKLEHLFGFLQNGSETDVAATLRRIRDGADLNELEKYLRDGDLLLQLGET